MVLDTHFYDILSVSPSSSTEQICKAYRKQALKCHPDKTNHNAQLTEKFKEMTRAYEVLKDDKMRQVYDRFGEAGLEGQPPPQRKQPQFAADIFSQVFSDFSMFSGFDMNPQHMKKVVNPVPSQDEYVRGQDIHHTCNVTLADLFYGKTIKLQLPKTSRCETCKGIGGLHPKTCRVCEGSGKVVTTYYNDFSQYQQFGSCRPCNGTGIYVAPATKCPDCESGYRRHKKLLRVNVLPGSRHNQRIVLQGEGDEGRKIIPGDVIIHLNEIKHPYLVRKYNDLYMEREIDLRTALLGGCVELHDFVKPGQSVRVLVNVHGYNGVNDSMNSSIKKAEIVGTINSDEPKLVRGFGMPINEMAQDDEYVENLESIDEVREVAFDLQRYKYGNLFINFKVKLPVVSSFSASDLDALSHILPEAKASPTPMKEAFLANIATSTQTSPLKEKSSPQFNYEDIDVGEGDELKEDESFYRDEWDAQVRKRRKNMA